MTGLFAIPKIQDNRAVTFLALSFSMILSMILFKAITWNYKPRELVSCQAVATDPLHAELLDTVQEVEA